jgi:hypothetical protein
MNSMKYECHFGIQKNNVFTHAQVTTALPTKVGTSCIAFASASEALTTNCAAYNS